MTKKISVKMMVVIYVLSAVLIAIDQISKYVIHSNLYVGEKITVIEDFFYITHCRNTGGAWSLFPAAP